MPIGWLQDHHPRPKVLPHHVQHPGVPPYLAGLQARSHKAWTVPDDGHHRH